MTAALHGGERLVGGRYELEGLLGRGGMGEVWRARHVALKVGVAIKFLHGGGEPSERARRRFLTEAQVTASLHTRHAVQVFDFGVSDDGRPYLVMELLEGETLDKRIRRMGRLPVATTSRYLQKAARALERAHALGIVHRDFKPENVMLVPDEEDGGEIVKVVDFGIAKLVGDLDATLKGALGQIAQARRPPSFGDGALAPQLDSSSSGVGTPNYMAPEQVEGSAQIGPAADIWAFGVVAYECLTGRRPFEGDSIGKLLARVIAVAPPPPASSLAPVPTLFDDWFRVACAQRPNDRFPDMQTAATALAFALDAPVVAVPTSVAVRDATPKPAASPTLASKRDPAEALVPSPLPEPEPELPARSGTGTGTSHVSPLAATLDPSPPPCPAPVSIPAAPRAISPLPRALVLAAAVLGVLIVTRDDARPRTPAALAAVAARSAELPRPIPDAFAMGETPKPPPQAFTMGETPKPPPEASPPQPAPAPSQPTVASADPAPASPAGSAKHPLPGSPSPRRPARRGPPEANPSAYRLPPLGL